MTDGREGWDKIKRESPSSESYRRAGDKISVCFCGELDGGACSELDVDSGSWDYYWAAVAVVAGVVDVLEI